MGRDEDERTWCIIKEHFKIHGKQVQLAKVDGGTLSTSHVPHINELPIYFEDQNLDLQEIAYIESKTEIIE